MKLHSGGWCGVMLHHTDTKSDKTVNDIRLIHTNKGWGDVGYHYLLQKDKNGLYHLKKGRDTKYQGAHCDVDDYNNKYIGLAIIGNFDYDTLSNENYKILKNAIIRLNTLYKCDKLLFHKHVKATNCPGKNISYNKLIGEKK